MRIILAGATGFIGGEVLRQCISNPAITSVLVVSRRDPAEELMGSSKVKVIHHQDFSEWPPSLLEQLEGAEGCIWTLGGKVEDFPDIATAKRVGIDYTLAAANAFALNLAPQLAGRKFPFIFCSGNGAEQQHDARLWLFSDTRKLKGAVEKGLLDVASATPSFETFILRPGGVLPDDSRVGHALANVARIPVVFVSALAKALVATCLTQPASRIIENNEIARSSQNMS